MIENIIEHLQFLRPMWFFAFVPLLLFVLLMLRRRLNSISWKAVCDERLLPHILTQGKDQSSRWPLILAIIASSLCIIAAAGPVYQKLPQPVYREQSALVVLLDLSQSMNATDIRPSRLQRARLKLLDLLKTRKAGQTALLVYAADTYVVTPLTDDTLTISNLVPSLESTLMPSQGSNAYIALKKSVELLKQAGINQGHVLLMTDGLQQRDMNAIDSLIMAGHRVSVMGVGTADGSPIPVEGGFLQDANGAIVLPRLNIKQLQQAAQLGRGIYVNLSADDSDLQRLKPFFESHRVETETKDAALNPLELTADRWQEEGPWLLLLVIPLAALWPRRGWILCLPLLILPIPEPAMAQDPVQTDPAQIGHDQIETPAFSLEQLWRRPDQKAMQSFKQGDHQSAAKQFEDPRWKASALYRSGDYDKALETLSDAKSSDDFYNRANALAQLGRYAEAIEAYDKALELDNQNDDAKHNREQVQQRLEQQAEESQQQDSQQQKNSDQDSSEKNQPDQDAQDNKDSQHQSEQSSESESSDSQQAQQQDETSEQQNSEQNQPQDQDQQNNENEDVTEEQEASAKEVNQALQDAQQQENEKIAEANDENKDQAEQQAYAMDESEAETESDPVTEQWLRRIPDDPGLLLKRKFYYQYQRTPNPVVSEQPW